MEQIRKADRRMHRRYTPGIDSSNFYVATLYTPFTPLPAKSSAVIFTTSAN